MNQLFDDNGITNFVDDLGNTYWVDDLNNFLGTPPVQSDPLGLASSEW